MSNLFLNYKKVMQIESGMSIQRKKKIGLLLLELLLKGKRLCRTLVNVTHQQKGIRSLV